jgi:hypothetical protein
VRFLMMFFVVTLLCSSAILFTPTVSAHGCAPPTPPPVAGSPAPAPASKGVILLNEILLNPQSTWNCSESGTDFVSKDTWVELYNPKNQPFNLYAAHAYLDSGPSTTIYYLPFGSAIAAHGFLVVFPRTVGNFAPEPAPTIRLLIASTTIDEVKVPRLAADHSYARLMDGASQWQAVSTPTINASNNTSGVSSTPTSVSIPAGYKRHTNGNGHNNTPFASGTQPVWSKIQLPTPAPVPTTSISSTALPSSPPAAGSSDLPRRIGMTALIVMLALALFWCWRAFKTS